ncbi:sulfotransferase family protein [Coleofasciculus chthonoplastes]|uniref:sulfotransferase family protein n=1 Tax=Coleofasciculus chthonoplastes TaxID=64178 RepID=UPI0032FC123A
MENIKNSRKPLLVYIAGYGRSGSTLLDTLLGNHPAIFSAGELSFWFEELLNGSLCSCGKPYHKCEFWQRIINQLHMKIPEFNYEEANCITRNVEKVTFSNKSSINYINLWEITFNSILEVSEKEIIVDSSKSIRKTFRRVNLLTKNLDFEVKVIHLVRDPRAVIWSIQRGSNRLLEAGKPAKIFGGMLRGLIGWILVNGAVEMMRLQIKPSDILFLRYEDIIAEPATQILRVGNFLNIDIETLIKHVEEKSPLNAGHGIAGNRMRRQGLIFFKKDEEWKYKLPQPIRLLSLLPLILFNKYGYK